MQTPDSDLLRRLERVERQNRLLVRLLGGGGLACIAVLVAAACGPQASSASGSGEGEATATAAGATATADTGTAARDGAAPGNGRFDVLEVEKLILRDRYGRQAALLETDPDRGTVLTLFDQEEREGLRFQVMPRISELVMSSNGVRRFDVMSSPDASASSLRIMDGNEMVVFQANTESGATGAFLLGPPNEKGIRSNIGMRMSPSGLYPHLTARNYDLETKVWTFEEN